MEKNIESELIGMLLEYPPHYHEVAEIITPKHFKNKLLSDVFQCMRVCIKKHNKFTPTLIKEYVTVACDIDLVDYLTMLQAEVTLGNAVQWAEVIREESDRSKIQSMLKEGIGKHVPVSEFIDDFMDRLLKIRVNAVDSSDTLGNLVRKEIDRADDRYKNEEPFGWNWGIPGLNSIVGRLIPGTLTTIIAPSGVGKSSAAMQIAYEVAKTHNVEIFQADMDLRQQGMRTLATLSDVDIRSIQEATFDDKEFDRMYEAGEDPAINRIIMHNNKQTIIENIKLKCMATKDKFGIGLVILDHSKLLKSNYHIRDQFERLRHVFLTAKEIAVDLDCAVIMLQQITKDMMRRNTWRIRIDDAYGGNEAREHSDLVLLLNRPEVIIRDLETDRKYTEEIRNLDLTDWKDKGYIKVGKNRNGPDGEEVELDWCGRRMLFYQQDMGDMFDLESTKI